MPLQAPGRRSPRPVQANAAKAAHPHAQGSAVRMLEWMKVSLPGHPLLAHPAGGHSTSKAALQLTLAARHCSVLSPSEAKPPPPTRPARRPQEIGMPPQKAYVQTVVREGQPIDVTVASEPLQPGDLALRIPERLVVTLDRIFEDGAVGAWGGWREGGSIGGRALPWVLPRCWDWAPLFASHAGRSLCRRYVSCKPWQLSPRGGFEVPAAKNLAAPLSLVLRAECPATQAIHGVPAGQQHSGIGCPSSGGSPHSPFAHFGTTSRTSAPIGAQCSPKSHHCSAHPAPQPSS
jgi:hypothetical protein